MTAFYIFRHGDTIETDNPLVGFFGHKESDSRSINILPKATPALARIGEYLKNIPTDANFSSPYPRCLDSAKIVESVSAKKFVADERIRELEKNGENFNEFTSRIKDFLKEIAEKKYSFVLICTHGAVIAAIKHFETGRRFFPFQVFDYPRPGNLVIIKEEKVSQINFNRIKESPQR